VNTLVEESTRNNGGTNGQYIFGLGSLKNAQGSTLNRPRGKQPKKVSLSRLLHTHRDEST
jgi:hypothetical protein